MHPKYQKGQKVRIYDPSQEILVIVEEIKQSGETWLYSFSDPETREIRRVHFAGEGSKIDWQAEKWLTLAS